MDCRQFFYSPRFLIFALFISLILAASNVNWGVVFIPMYIHDVFFAYALLQPAPEAKAGRKRFIRFLLWVLKLLFDILLPVRAEHKGEMTVMETVMPLMVGMLIVGLVTCYEIWVNMFRSQY